MACYTCERKAELNAKKLIIAKEKAQALKDETRKAVVVVVDGYGFKAMPEEDAKGRVIVEYFI